jgi:hypothetical protein
MFKKPPRGAGRAAPRALTHAGNPLVTNIFTADPAALVDGNRVYLYVGRDEAAPEGKDYLMREWRVLSSCDMKHWTDLGSPLNVKTFKWAKADAWAADVTRRNGKYYFYAPLEHDASKPGKAIGVAVSDKPTGPFVDARGTALVTNDMTKESDIAWDDIDPAVFIDKDGQAYLYWGNRVLKYAKLKSNMIELDGPVHTVGIDNFTEAAYLHLLPDLLPQLPRGDRVRHRSERHRPVDFPRQDHGREQGGENHPPGADRLQRQVLYLLPQRQAAWRRRIPPLGGGGGTALQARRQHCLHPANG